MNEIKRRISKGKNLFDPCENGCGVPFGIEKGRITLDKEKKKSGNKRKKERKLHERKRERNTSVVARHPLFTMKSDSLTCNPE